MIIVIIIQKFFYKFLGFKDLPKIFNLILHSNILVNNIKPFIYKIYYLSLIIINNRLEYFNGLY